MAISGIGPRFVFYNVEPALVTGEQKEFEN